MAFFFLILVDACFGGAWNRGKHQGYFQLGFTSLHYGQLLNGAKENIDLKRNIFDYTLQFYGEYGLSKKWNVIFKLPFKYVSTSDRLNDAENDPYSEDTLQSGNLSGFSNPSFALKYEMANTSYVLSVQAEIHGNLSSYDESTGLRIGYDAWLLSPSLLFGKSWKDHYVQTQAGVTFNSENYSNNFTGNLEVGRKLWKGNSLVILRFDAKLPISQGNFDEGNSVQTGLYRDNSSYLSPGLKWIQRMAEGFSLNLAAYGALYSELEGNQATLNVGLAYEW